MVRKIMKRIKKMVYSVITIIMIISMSTTISLAAGRKIIAQQKSGDLNLWSAYNYHYYFTANAVLTYGNSNNITQISDLSFTNVGYTCSYPTLSASFIPRQISKNYNSSVATYVVTVTRSVYGYYSDKVDYTLNYRVSDAGTPYSFDANLELVEVIESEPYDIQLYNEMP